MQYFFHQVNLIMGVLPAGDCNGTVIPVPVHTAILITDGLQFLPSCIPIDVFSSFKRLAAGANAFFIERNARPGIRHNAFFAVSHIMLLINCRVPVCIGQDSREGRRSFQPDRLQKTPAVSSP